MSDDSNSKNWERLEGMLDLLEGKLDLLDQRLDSIDLTLVRQHLTLEEHQRRSVALEARVEQVDLDLAPIKSHVAAWGGVGKALVIVCGLVGAVAAAWRMFGS